MNQINRVRQSCSRIVRIYASLETERSISIKTMEFRSFSNRNRVEISTFQENSFGFRRNTTVTSTENAGNAKWLIFSVFDNDFGTVQSSFHTIQRFKFCSFFYRTDFHGFISNLVCIKSVKRLSKTVKDIIGDIYHIINWRKANRFEPVFQPIR